MVRLRGVSMNGPGSRGRRFYLDSEREKKRQRGVSVSGALEARWCMLWDVCFCVYSVGDNEAYIV